MRPLTLSAMKAQGMDLRVFCSVCGHFAVMDASGLIERLGGNTAVQDTRPHLRCGKCRTRLNEGWEITVMPDWHIGKEAKPFGPKGFV